LTFFAEKKTVVYFTNNVILTSSVLTEPYNCRRRVYSSQHRAYLQRQ